MITVEDVERVTQGTSEYQSVVWICVGQHVKLLVRKDLAAGCPVLTEIQKLQALFKSERKVEVVEIEFY